MGTIWKSGIYHSHSQSMVRTPFMGTATVKADGNCSPAVNQEEEEMDLGVSQPVLAISLNYPIGIGCMRKQQ